jgi:hypothetical protein
LSRINSASISARRTTGKRLAQALDIGAVRGVGALHGVAEVDEHLGDAAHADAADPDEVDRTSVARQFHRFSPPWSRAAR